MNGFDYLILYPRQKAKTRERAVTTAYASHSSFTEHDFPRHPEHAGRIKAVWEQLSRQRLLDQVEQLRRRL